jgi:hypothetical protein
MYGADEILVWIMVRHKKHGGVPKDAEFIKQVAGTFNHY